MSQIQLENVVQFEVNTLCEENLDHKKTTKSRLREPCIVLICMEGFCCSVRIHQCIVAQTEDSLGCRVHSTPGESSVLLFAWSVRPSSQAFHHSGFCALVAGLPGKVQIQKQNAQRIPKEFDAITYLFILIMRIHTSAGEVAISFSALAVSSTKVPNLTQNIYLFIL